VAQYQSDHSMETLHNRVSATVLLDTALYKPLTHIRLVTKQKEVMLWS